MECWISKILRFSCWEWGDLIVAIFSFAGGSAITRLFVGKKLDQLVSFQKEEDRKKTEEAIADLSRLKFILEGEREKIDLHKVWELEEKYEDYLNLREKLVLRTEILRRIDRALSLIQEHGYHEGRKYMLEELQEKDNEGFTNPRFWENQS